MKPATGKVYCTDIEKFRNNSLISNNRIINKYKGKSGELVLTIGYISNNKGLSPDGEILIIPSEWYLFKPVEDQPVSTRNSERFTVVDKSELKRLQDIEYKYNQIIEAAQIITNKGIYNNDN